MMTDAIFSVQGLLGLFCVGLTVGTVIRLTRADGRR